MVMLSAQKAADKNQLQKIKAITLICIIFIEMKALIHRMIASVDTVCLITPEDYTQQ